MSKRFWGHLLYVYECMNVSFIFECLPHLMMAMPTLPMALCIPGMKTRNSRERQPAPPMGKGSVSTNSCRARASRKSELTA